MTFDNRPKVQLNSAALQEDLSLSTLADSYLQEKVCLASQQSLNFRYGIFRVDVHRHIGLIG